MRIVISGGGTAGSVIPLLAIAEQCTKDNIFFIGTKHGVERRLIPEHITYYSIPAGKFRRYWHWRTVFEPLIIFFGLWKALALLLRLRPNVVVSAGSFVSVPVIWAAWILGIPSLVHQQDLQVGLATKLMKPFATTLTKAFQDIPLRGEWTGNPVRDLTPTTQAFAKFSAAPIVLITGGGTGATGINQLVAQDLCEQAEVIHITGPGKGVNHFSHPQYHAYELLTEDMKEALHKASIVVSRAGLSTITELITLKKPTILIPMPQSHQVLNAQWLAKHQAAIILDQADLTPAKFTKIVQELLQNPSRQQALQAAMHSLHKPHATERCVKIMTELAQQPNV